MKVAFTLNGKRRTYDGPGMRRLLDVLREDFALPGTKEGCSGWSRSGRPSDSTVATRRPATWATGTRQLTTAAPSSRSRSRARS